MSYGQYYWLTKRTRILYEDYSKDNNIVTTCNPMSSRNMALALVSIILTEAGVMSTSYDQDDPA